MSILAPNNLRIKVFLRQIYILINVESVGRINFLVKCIKWRHFPLSTEESEKMILLYFLKTPSVGSLRYPIWK